MGVVVDKRRAVVDAADVEATGDSPELRQGVCRRIEIDPHRTGHGQRAECVAHVVDAAQRQVDGTQDLTSVHDGEGVRAMSCMHVDRPVVGGRCRAVRDGAMTGCELRAHRVVDAEDLRTGDPGEVPIEAGDDRFFGAVEVEMIDLDVGEDGAEERQLEMGAVALVGFDDQPLPIRPLCARAHVGDVTADDERRP